MHHQVIQLLTQTLQQVIPSNISRFLDIEATVDGNEKDADEDEDIGVREGTFTVTIHFHQ